MIFLTGGTGLLGRHILAQLQHAGDPITALARSDHAATALRILGATPLTGDVDSPALWNQVDGCRAIVHSAAIIASRAGWEGYRRVNVDGTRLAAARARALGVPLIHISSVAVYGANAGRQPAGSVSEEYPLGSSSAGPHYGRSKRLAEAAVLEEVARGLRAIILRPCVVYGEGDRLFLPTIARHARRGYFPLVGTGQQPMAMVHARSVAEAVGAALRAERGWGQAFNVTNDDEITGLAFVAALSAGLGRPVRPIRIPRPLANGAAAAGDLTRVLLRSGLPGLLAAVRFLEGGNPFNSGAARRTLGWTPTVRHSIALPAAIQSL